MAEHNIKLSQPYFYHVCEGKKKFEYRYNDRNYQINDTVKM
jgi:ASC-1-like (ASCH) protein